MKRMFFCSLLSLVFICLWQTIALFLPSFLNVFLMMPVCIFFCLQFLKPLEIIFSCIFVGIIVDSLGGISLGVTSISSLFVVFVLTTVNMFSARVMQPLFSFYMLGISFFYRLSFLFFYSFLIGKQTNFLFSVIILGPFIDVLLAPLFFFILIKIFALFKAFEHHDQKGNYLA